jgi:hypothetical protein
VILKAVTTINSSQSTGSCEAIKLGIAAGRANPSMKNSARVVYVEVFSD